jgi:hypothetical protein
MKASKTPACRLIEYHAANLSFDGAAALRQQIMAYVRGVRGQRLTPVTEKQIIDWFRATDAAFLRRQLTEVVALGQVRICSRSLSSNRRHNGGYVYEIATAED